MGLADVTVSECLESLPCQAMTGTPKKPMAHLVATEQSQQLPLKDHYMVGKEQEGANAAVWKRARKGLVAVDAEVR